MEYYVKKKRKKRRAKARIFLSCFVLFFLLCFIYLECVINPIVVETTKQAVFSLSTTAVSDAVYDVLKDDNITYDDLVEIKYSDDGKVRFITLQTTTLNLIARRFYQVAQVYLDKMGENGVNVNLGIFTGLPFLAGIGPKINLKLVSIGAMTSQFESNFKSAGINQTNHSVYVRLYASVSMILPAYSKTIDSVTEMVVAESVIVGDVPSVYLGENRTLQYTPS